MTERRRDMMSRSGRGGSNDVCIGPGWPDPAPDMDLVSFNWFAEVCRKLRENLKPPERRHASLA